MELPLTGGCICGSVRYAITAASLSVYACHCTDCQRITSSAFSIGVVVPASAFRSTSSGPQTAPGGLRLNSNGDKCGIAADELTVLPSKAGCPAGSRPSGEAPEQGPLRGGVQQPASGTRVPFDAYLPLQGVDSEVRISQITHGTVS
jgi:hypothetical protein